MIIYEGWRGRENDSRQERIKVLKYEYELES